MERDTLKLLRLAKGFLDSEDDFKAVRILRKLIKEKRGEHYPAEWLAELYFNRKEWKPALYYAQSAFDASEKKEQCARPAQRLTADASQWCRRRTLRPPRR